MHTRIQALSGRNGLQSIPSLVPRPQDREEAWYTLFVHAQTIPGFMGFVQHGIYTCTSVSQMEFS